MYFIEEKILMHLEPPSFKPIVYSWRSFSAASQ